MNKKTIFIICLLVVVVLVLLSLSNLKSGSVADNKPQVKSKQVLEEWKIFTNERFKYTFEHPVSVSKDDRLSGRGADFSSDIDSKITFDEGGTGIFNVTRLYLDEKTIKDGINSNIISMRNNGALEKDIEEYSQRMEKEFSNTRKYRDIPLNDFAPLVQEAIGNATGLPIKTTIDGISAYEFTWSEASSSSDMAVSLRLGYSFLSSFGTHSFVLFENSKGQKYYIHYKPENVTSVRMMKSFHFIK